MKDVKKLSKKQLIEEYKTVNETIEVFDYYGIKDLKWREMLEQEIDKRGIEIKIELR